MGMIHYAPDEDRPAWRDAPDDGIEHLLQLLDMHPIDALREFCHEGLTIDDEREDDGSLTGDRVASVCSMEGYGETDEAAIKDLVRQVRERLKGGAAGC